MTAPKQLGASHLDFKPILDDTELDGRRWAKAPSPSGEAPFTRAPECNDRQWLFVFGWCRRREKQHSDRHPRQCYALVHLNPPYPEEPSIEQLRVEFETLVNARKFKPESLPKFKTETRLAAA